MKTLKIQIPNMQSSHCQMRVNNALSTISDASSITTKPGEASLTLPIETSVLDVITIIEKAGYYVTDISEDDMNLFHHTETENKHAHC
ncbi:heavy-metal-associated domain-containing protein [Mariniflexile soesokkakense]|uniref:Heavy-metal-associated domain-containing protein n=1 Tax=Mariniflexile soesokkakense TaxID=1343160 RepID=A0ABV0ACZ1_9FLAO